MNQTSQFSIRRLNQEDSPRLREFWITHWGDQIIVVNDEIIRYDQVEGFTCNDWDGLVTFRIHKEECEITSLDSLQPGKGIGSTLINEVIREARANQCRRLFLITTNDNLDALGFYQRRGFELAAIHRGAVTRARKIKPSISMIGANNIPLRDEIELEFMI